MTTDADPSPRIAGVAPAWRTIAMVLAVGIAAYAAVAWHHARAERGEPVPLVREVAPPDPRPDHQPLDTVDFDHVRLADALVVLGPKAGLNVVSDWDSDTAAWADMPVTLHLRRATFAAVIDALNVQVNGPFHDIPLAWDERDGIVRVTTRPRLENDPRDVVVRVYDVQPILAQIPATPAVTNQSSRFTVTNQTQFNGDDDPGYQLVQLVKSNVAPASWIDAGGNVGSLQFWAGQLIVTQSKYNQRGVAAFLRLLRRRDG